MKADCDLLGNVVMGNGWQANDRTRIGLSRLDRGADNWQHLQYNTYFTGANGTFIGDKFWGFRFNAPMTFQWVFGDISDTSAYDYWPIRVKQDQYGCEAMTHDPGSGIVYAVMRSYEDRKPYLCTIELPTDRYSKAVRVGNPIDDSYTCFGMGVSSNGTIYGVFGTFADTDGDADAALYTIDKVTAALTKVGDVNVPLHYSGSATIYPKNDKMYLSGLSAAGVGALYEIDITSGASTRILVYPEGQQVLALSWVKAPAEDLAPAIATEPKANFRGPQLSGTVDFTAPTTFYNEEPGTGNLSYQVEMDGVSVATGSTTWGERVQVPVTAPKAGMHEFTVTTSNAAGKSPALTFNGWVGHDVPKPVEDVVAAYAGGRMLVAWDAASETEHGADVDLNLVSYTVVRYPDATQVATGIKATNFVETLAESETAVRYSYGIIVNYNGSSSAESKSNGIFVGNYTVPYSHTFQNAGEESLEQFEIINANGDDRTWIYSFSCARVLQNSTGGTGMDDYLLSHYIKLEPGKRYCLTLNAFSWMKSAGATIEAKLGTGDDPAQYTLTAVPPTKMDWDTERPIMGMFEVPAAGNYRLAIHACSDKDGSHLHLNGFSLTEAEMPAAPDAFTVIPAADRSASAVIKVTAPSKSFNGMELDNLTAVTIYRDGTAIHTYDNPTPGEPLEEWTDTEVPVGNRRYTATATNQYGEGPAAEITVYVGIGSPRAPQNVVAESIGEGRVKLTWEAPTHDSANFPLSPADLTYKVYVAQNGFWQEVDNVPPVSGNQVEFAYLDADAQQQFVEFGIGAVTIGGDSPVTEANLVAVGKDYEVPYVESFADGLLRTVWGVEEYTSTTVWALATDNMVSGLSSQDHDNGMAVMQGLSLDDSGAFYSGNINLGTLNNPELSFFSYTFGEDNMNVIEVWVIVDGEKYCLETFALDGPAAWRKYTVNLRRFRGKTIRLIFVPQIISYTLVAIDNVRIDEPVGHDLVAVSLDAPAKVRQGDKAVMAVSYYNNGTNDLEEGEYSVDLYRDGEMLESLRGKKLPAGENATASFEVEFNALSSDSHTFHAVLVSDLDINLGNNATAEATVGVIVNDYPAPTGLRAEQTGAGEVSLVWDAVTTPASVASAKTTEDFEQLTSWSLEGENGWTFADGDGMPVVGFADFDLPGITSGETTAAFFVFDNNDARFNASFGTHSGTKCLAALARWDDGKVDDWAISPELSGNEQTITFWARSYSGNYPETLQVLYSVGGTEISDFLPVRNATFANLTTEWTQFSVTLPAGSTRFALRSTATAAFMLMIDDVTFEAGTPFENIAVDGCNLYRDGQRLNIEPITDNSFVDREIANGTHTYVVAAVYNFGEGRPSEPVSIEAGIADVIGAGVKIETDRHIIRVSAPASAAVSIVGAAGVVVARGNGSMTANVAPGVYIVTVNGSVSKVAVP